MQRKVGLAPLWNLLLWQSKGTRAKLGINSVWTCGSVTPFTQSVARWLGSIIQLHLESLNNRKTMFKGQFLIFFQDRKFTWGYRCFSNAVNSGQLVLLFYKCNDIRRSFRSFVKLISTTNEKCKGQSKSPCVNTQSRWTPTHKNIYLSIHPSIWILTCCFHILFTGSQMHLGSCLYQAALKHRVILIWFNGASPIMATPASAQTQLALSSPLCWSDCCFEGARST